MCINNLPLFFLSLTTDYGADVMTVTGRRAYERATRPARPRQINSAARYAGLCRAIGVRLGLSLPIDGRLIGAGWNLVPPRRWVGGELERFVDYWERAVDRPNVVGSSFNTVSPDDAARAWAAGMPAALCGRLDWIRDREGRTRRMPRERVRRLLSAARALRRTSVGSRNVSTKALARLGQLCPELQRVALASLPDGWTDKPLRVRDLDWTAVSRLQKALASDVTGRIRAAHATGMRQIALVHARVTNGTDAAWMCPSYPAVVFAVATRIARGESPAQVAAMADGDAKLTNAEAHAWALAGAPENVLGWWLLKQVVARPAFDYEPNLRSWAVARWLFAVFDRGDWGALTRERNIRGPGNVVVQVRYLDRVDEIQDCDLERGTRTGVEAAFQHAAERVGEAWLEKARGDHRVLAELPANWRLYPCMRHLATPAQLAREGDEMHHCVGGYAPAVESGRSVVLAINVNGERSTVELDRYERVLQHYGPSNSKPHELCERVLNNFLVTRTRPARIVIKDGGSNAGGVLVVDGAGGVLSVDDILIVDGTGGALR